ncbi:MAG: hypothetical protein M3314_14830 [Actinomycetota bacterium]|nr:hypothetical protein [Actinomycetota bacterium]
MTDPTAGDRTTGTGVPPEGAPGTGVPTWVKLSLIIALALVLLLVIGKLTGLGGEHGPGRHGGGDGTPSTVVNVDTGHRPPADHRP